MMVSMFLTFKYFFLSFMFRLHVQYFWVFARLLKIVMQYDYDLIICHWFFKLFYSKLDMNTMKQKQTGSKNLFSINENMEFLMRWNLRRLTFLKSASIFYHQLFKLRILCFIHDRYHYFKTLSISCFHTIKHYFLMNFGVQSSWNFLCCVLRIKDLLKRF